MPRRRIAIAGSLIGLAVVAGGALRLGLLEARPPSRLLGDERYYVNVAVRIANGAGHYSSLYDVRAGWPPLHPFFLSRFVTPGSKQLPSSDRQRLLRAQVALGTLLVGATGLLAWALFDARAAVAAAGGAALYPTFVAFSHYFWSETLFAVLLTLGLAACVWARAQRGGAGWMLAAGAGALLGLAGLTREVGLLVAFACAGWWIASAPPGGRRRAAAGGALLLACAAAVVLPWTLRNFAVLGRLVPVSTVGWMGAREGNTLPESGWLGVDMEAVLAFRREYFAVPDELGRMELARAQTLERVRAEQPTWLAKKLVRSALFLFHPGSYLFFKMHNEGYVGLTLRDRRVALVATLTSYAAVLLLFAAALPGAPGPGRRSFPLWVLTLGLCVHVAANATTRYRMPFVPLLLAYAGWALAHPRATRAALRGRRWLVPAAALLLLLAGGAYFARDAAAIWTTGRLAGVAQS